MNQVPKIANDLDGLWMLFTASRIFKDFPRMVVGASGCHYTSNEGRQLIDGTGGLWCSNADH